MANAKFCRQCGTQLTSGAHFCANCGAGLDASAPSGRGGAPSGAQGNAPSGMISVSAMVPWFVLASLMMAVLGYLIGARGAPASGAASGEAAAAFADQGGIITAPDISTLSPEERVDRLFNRVMALASAGKQDSVQFFAPMAINALAALMPLDAHRRYDWGLISLAAGDPGTARAQSDTILAAQPTHLLGLALAMRAATSQGRAADAKRLGAKLIASATIERAKGLREYADHAPDVTEALEEAAGTRTSRIAQPR
jgi:zinc-ribbon domain